MAESKEYRDLTIRLHSESVSSSTDNSLNLLGLVYGVRSVGGNNPMPKLDNEAVDDVNTQMMNQARKLGATDVFNVNYIISVSGKPIGESTQYAIIGSGEAVRKQ